MANFEMSRLISRLGFLVGVVVVVMERTSERMSSVREGVETMDRRVQKVVGIAFAVATWRRASSSCPMS